MQRTSQYYTRTAQMLHWLMAIIFIAAWLIGFYSGNFLSYDVDGSFKGQVIKLTKITKHAKRHFWLNDVCTCHGLLPSHSA